MRKNILVPMANGVEDIELVTILDILKRAKDVNANINIICASISNTLDVTMDTGLVIKAETLLDNVDVSTLDSIVLPGGFSGMANLKANPKIISIVQKLHKEKKLIGAICSSPIILAEAGVLSEEYTCYPGCDANIVGKKLEKPVVVKDNIITSAGPSTAAAFAFTVLRELGFNDEVEGVMDGLMFSQYSIDF